MTQLLAIEWDAREARIAVARTRGKDLTLDSAFAVPIGAGDDSASSETVGQKIGAALRQRGIGKLETLVAVGRSNIELKQFAVPSAPEDELPEIVRFQSLRQFTSLGDDWPLDYVKLDTPESVSVEGESISVLAATIAPDLLKQIRDTCEQAGLSAKRLVLRPFAAASLLRRGDRDRAERCRLMVDLLTDEADLTVLDDQRVLLTRTVRLHAGEGGESQAQARGLLGEIRRTIAAASNQLGGRRVEKVILCGDGNDHASLKTLVEQELSLPVELFDPFAEVQLTGSRPRHSGRFAPLLGMLRDEAASVPHAIDFLHPRKKPEAANTRRRTAIIAAGVLLAGIIATGLVGMRLASLTSEIATLKGQVSIMKPKLAAADAKRKEEAAVQEFLDHGINWLDELESLSKQLPPPEDVVLTDLSLQTHQPNGETIKLEGYAREATTFKAMEERLRAEGRIVSSSPKANDPKGDKYKYGVNMTIRILPPGGETEKQKKAPRQVGPSSGGNKAVKAVDTSARTRGLVR